MTVHSATVQRNPGTQVGELMTFPDPAVGESFTTTVPTGQAWRLWGGSCHMAGSAAVTHRTPCLVLASGAPFASGTVYYYVASNGQDYDHDADQTIVFYQQQAFNEGPPFMTGAGQTWDFTNNPASRVYNPVGCQSIWLPPGTVITFYMHNIQAGDQLSQCALLVESLNVADGPIDGLGALMTFASPAVGQGWTTTVPAGRRWRIHGGSSLITTTSTVISRFPSIEFKKSNAIPWFGSQLHAATASGAYNAVYHRAAAYLTDLYVNRFVPVAMQPIWLEENTVITGGWANMQAADQVSDVGLLVEDVPM